MPELILTYALWGIRILVLPLIASAVVFSLRNRAADGGRERKAVAVGLAVALGGSLSVGLHATFPFPTAVEMFGFTVNVFGTFCAGAIVEFCCHGGMLLGAQHGGYWVKSRSRPTAAAIACIGGTGLSLAFSLPIFIAFDASVAPGQVPSGVAAWGAFLSKTLVFSFSEEVVYRGWALAALLSGGARIRLSPWSANLTVAIVFAAQHTGGAYQMLTALWAGLVLGAIFQRHGLIAAASTHVMLNLLAVLLVPLLP